MDVKSQACVGSISMLAMSFVQYDKHQNCDSSPHFCWIILVLNQKRAGWARWSSGNRPKSRL